VELIELLTIIMFKKGKEELLRNVLPNWSLGTIKNGLSG